MEVKIKKGFREKDHHLQGFLDLLLKNVDRHSTYNFYQHLEVILDMTGL